MILNYKSEPGEQLSRECIEYAGGKVFVDGVEIFQAWYIDTEAGIVKSYDVLGDGCPHLNDAGQVQSKTIIGNIQLIKPHVRL